MTSMASQNGLTARAALRSTALSAAEVPTRVRVAPWGEVTSSNGSFVMDAEAGRLVIEAFASQGNDLPIDYEHQTLGGTYASPSGRAPAAGWIKRLEAIDGEGLFAEVEWTPDGMAHLAAKEYRYLSPVAIVRRSDGRMVGLHSAALTNKPAIVEMEPIVNRSHDEPQSDEDADVVSALAAAREEVAALRAEAARRGAADRVLVAMSAGKLAESQRAWATDFALRLPDEFDAWLASAPVVVPCGRTAAPTIDSSAVRGRQIERDARREYRSHPVLASLTSEEAYVAEAVRRGAA